MRTFISIICAVLSNENAELFSFALEFIRYVLTPLLPDERHVIFREMRKTRINHFGYDGSR